MRTPAESTLWIDPAMGLNQPTDASTLDRPESHSFATRENYTNTRTLHGHGMTPLQPSHVRTTRTHKPCTDMAWHTCNLQHHATYSNPDRKCPVDLTQMYLSVVQSRPMLRDSARSIGCGKSDMPAGQVSTSCINK